MSTRLRPIVMLSDSVVAGGNARLALESTAKILKLGFPARGSMPEDKRLIEIFHSILSRGLMGSHWLWLFREPRNTPASRSRYAQLCQYYGLRPCISKKKSRPSFEEALDDAIRQRDQRRIVQNTAARIVEQQRQEMARLQQAVDWYQPQPPMSFSSQAAMQQGISMNQPAFQDLGGNVFTTSSAPTMTFRWATPEEEQP